MGKGEGVGSGERSGQERDRGEESVTITQSSVGIFPFISSHPTDSCKYELIK